MEKDKRKSLKKSDFGFQALEDVTKPTVATDHAAYLLNRVPRTLRGWASLENAPIRPIRVFGKLAWNVDDIKRLLAGGA